MAEEVNSHVIRGEVLGKAGPFVIKEDMNKNFLYVRAKYMVNNKIRYEDIKATCYSWGDHASRIDKVLPGDVVEFGFNLSGRYNPEYRDKKYNSVSCWTEVVVATKVDILDTTQRKLYNNDPAKKDNDYSDLANPNALKGYGAPKEVEPKNDDYDSGLPF